MSTYSYSLFNWIESPTYTYKHSWSCSDQRSTKKLNQLYFKIWIRNYLIVHFPFLRLLALLKKNQSFSCSGSAASKAAVLMNWNQFTLSQILLLIYCPRSRWSFWDTCPPPQICSEIHIFRFLDSGKWRNMVHIVSIDNDMSLCIALYSTTKWPGKHVYILNI